MAGACNGLQMACPKCQKIQSWDPFPDVEQHPTAETQQLDEKQ